MALANDYTTGTLTLTSGSANFTTSGAALQSANIRAGDQILLPAKGMVLTIASVSGQNAGTLTDACPAAAAGAGQTYRIRFQPDASRVPAALQAVLDIADGNVSALAGLSGAADKMPYFTGAGAMAVAGLSAFARTLLDDANAAAVLTTLGVPYQTGTFTPGISFGGASTGIAYGASTSGAYVRWADMVYMTGWIALTNKGTATGAAAITGLPFSRGSADFAGSIFPRITGMAAMTGLLAGYSNTNFITLVQGASTGPAGVTDANFTNSTAIFFSHLMNKA
jgi:hypothetical protein